MAKIPLPTVQFPLAPSRYDQREEQEFRRLVMLALSSPVEDLIRPSLTVTVTPSSTQYDVVVTWTGTMTYTIDGGAVQNGTTSPQTLNISRNDYLGAAKTYVFSVVNNGQTTSTTVVVPAKSNVDGVTFAFDSPQTANAGTNVYTYSWTATGFPTGTTYNWLYKFTNTAGTLVEEGTVTGATSGGTVNSAGAIGASPAYVMTLNAVKSGTIIATVSATGLFTT